jgi:hypothetical protein
MITLFDDEISDIERHSFMSALHIGFSSELINGSSEEQKKDDVETLAEGEVDGYARLLQVRFL